MRLFILFLSLVSSNWVFSQDLNTQTTELANSAEVKNGRFSFYAKNLSTGKTLVSQDIERKMSPASTLKILTNYAAMDVLGPDHRFSTRVGYTGTVNEQGILVGDIVIEAGGDPALGSEYFREHYGKNPIEYQVASAIKSAGIKEIKGRVLYDESIYVGIEVPDEWTWQDMGNYYATGVHAFTYAENMVKVSFRTGSIVGTTAQIIDQDYEIPGLKIDNEVKAAAISSDQAYFYSSPHSSNVKVYGRIPLNQRSFEVKGAMPDPSSVFTSRLTNALNNMGVSVSDNVIKGPDVQEWERDVQELIRFESPRLEELIAFTNLKSNNLFAEHFLRQIGKNRKGEGSFEKGIVAIKEWCLTKGISTSGLQIKDGSGLSRANSVTTTFFVELLTKLNSESYYEIFKIGLPVAGRSGSMSRIGKNSAIEGKMFAKTGYLEGVRAYSGILELGEETIVFSIMANDYNLSASQMRVKMAALMERLAQ